MRRLAKQNRKDKVRSKRDYQTITSGAARSFKFSKDNKKKRVLKFYSDHVNLTDLCLGIYIKPDVDCDAKITIYSNGEEKYTVSHHFRSTWNRFGLYIDQAFDEPLEITISIQEPLTKLSLWGEAICDSLRFKELLGLHGPLPKEFSQCHLVPESFFIDHEKPTMEIDKASSNFQSIENEKISLKKCAYCQRLLPIDPNCLLQLSFHKHKSKISGHQNECRACKKFRINDYFNPKRTSDQLHESSVITREKKILLQEPIILQKFKDRETGEGLRSHIWQKFGKKCFKCKASVGLNEYELDHTRPLSYLWPIDQHATCLCSKCNNYKKDRFPIDFYSEAELERLSKLTALSVNDLKTRSVNATQLNRLKKNIVSFAKEYDPRTFKSIANRVLEFMPEENLFNLLKERDENTYNELIQELSLRPESIEEVD